MELDQQALPDLLDDHFGLPGVLHFERAGELVRAQVTLPTCSATIYLQGAHLVHWQPTGQQPAIFLSNRSDLKPGKPIRGGVPICFPWFANRSDGKPGPSHGFARIQPWTVTAAALLPGHASGPAEPTLHLTFTQSPTELSRSLGFDNFMTAYEIILGKDAGRSLTLRLTVANLGKEPLHFEEALHTYFHVADIHQVEVTGLESASFIDKTDDFKTRQLPPTPLKIMHRTDSVFPNATGPVAIHDPGNRRVLTNTKSNSATTVVWNPWSDGAATLPDLAPDDWLSYLAAETANTGANAITLAPNQTHTMQTEITLHRA